MLEVGGVTSLPELGGEATVSLVMKGGKEKRPLCQKRRKGVGGNGQRMEEYLVKKNGKP